MHSKVSSIALVLAAGGALSGYTACACAADVDQYYHFVDQRGVPHFTNVPMDARYKPIHLTQRTLTVASPNVFRPRTPAHSARPEGPMPQTPDDDVQAMAPSDR